jgi:hypothetical protein
MASQIDDLVQMRDIETLFEIMAEDEDWMTQLDAAEGLVKLGDKRGLEFLLSAKLSEEKDVRDVAKEILDSPRMKSMLDEINAEDRRRHQERVENARKRLQKGGKVFQYKMVFLPTTDFLDEDLMSEGFDIPVLNEFGLEGWEVVNVISRQGRTFDGGVSDSISGAYFLMKRKTGAEELG